MRLLDFLNWIPGVRQYRNTSQINDLLVEQNRQLTLQVITLTEQVNLKNSMKSLATALVPIPRKPDPTYILSEKGERMSTLTWHEERLMRIELQSYREQVERLLVKNQNG